MRKSMFVCLCIAMLCIGCKKENNNAPEVVQSVDWTASEQVEKSQSMTMVILPEGEMMAAVDTAKDVVAIFDGDVCLAVNHLRQLGVGYRAYFLVYAPEKAATQSVNLTFRYFSAAKQRVYRTEQMVTFETDKALGTTDSPYSVKFE